MALVLADRIKETTTTTGTGTITLGGAQTGFESFAGIGDGNTTYYVIQHTSANEFEVGLGTYTSSGTTLSRDTIYTSSNSDAAVNFSAGTKIVFVAVPTEATVYEDASGDVAIEGQVTVGGNPTANLEVATKQYVDNLVASALHFHDAVRVEKEGNLNATYDNGTAGVGATLTNAGTQEALVIDGVTLNTSDRVLVYEQTDATQNGIYTVTNTGSVSTNWVLTRATDADSYAPGTSDGLDEGSYFYVQEGTEGAGESYVCNTIGTITFGTTDITFIQFSATPDFTGGTNIDVSGQTISLTGTVDETNGGTGNNTYTTGDTLYASASNTLAKLSGNTTTTKKYLSQTGTGSASQAPAWDEINLGTDTAGDYIATGAVSGVGLSGSASGEGSTFTVTSNATNANTASTIVARDASGNFSAGTITAALSGNASTATTWQTARSLTLSGDVTGTATGINGSGNIAVTTTIAANSVALGTDTTGNYVAALTEGTAIDITSASGEGVTPTINLDLNELATSTTNSDGDYFVVVDSADGSQHKLTKGNIAISGFNNDSGFITSTNLVDDTTPQLGGNLDTNGNDINFGDNDKAIFGAGSDLQIYHDGSNSYIEDTGTGNLRMKGATKVQLLADNNEDMLHAIAGGAVEIYYDNAKKFETTSTGVDVTGTVTADGLTVDGNTLHVDAANNRVGIGTSSPDNTLHVHTGSAGAVTAHVDFDDLVVESNGNMGMSFLSPNDTFQQIGFGDADDNDIGKIAYQHTNDSMQFIVNAAERMRVNSSGSVGIGDNNPQRTLSVNGIGKFLSSITLGGTVSSTDSNAYFTNEAFANNSDSSTVSLGTVGTRSLIFATNSIERVTIDTSGNMSVTGDITSSSDELLKENIQPITDALSKVQEINGVSFNWKDSGKASIGVIAQNLETVIPELVSKNAEGVRSVAYGNMVGLLIEAIKEQQASIEKLEARIAELEA